MKGTSKIDLIALPGAIGSRETVHANCLHSLTENEVLYGKNHDDTIALGTYRIDIHHQGGDGITFKYLDGSSHVTHADGRREHSRWRPEGDDPPYYQIPYRSLVPREGPANLLLAGCHIDADPGAFGAIRVMVNCNQMGEAAGEAAVICIQNEIQAAKVPVDQVQDNLRHGGSLLP